jgi:glycosyltransferase involved in cell wall biosynthesis
MVSERAYSGGTADISASREMEALKSPVQVLSHVKVSVIVCTYTLDMYEHFREAADSVLAQTHDDVELVVVVDGTPEVYNRVRENYGDHGDTVVACNDENVGLLASRNRGAELASGDVVAFIDDDAVADETWVERLMRAYEEEDAIAAGGKMTPEWIAGKPSFLPEEFYWLVGVTHRGFADGPGEVRNTFGSNISFHADVFEELGGFDVEIGGRKGDKNLQGGETELCARMREKYKRGVWYDPEAVVAHKVFEYRTELRWLMDRAFWQGYSKRAMESFVDDERGEESEFLRYLLLTATPNYTRHLISAPSSTVLKQLGILYVLTVLVGLGYVYAIPSYFA